MGWTAARTLPPICTLVVIDRQAGENVPNRSIWRHQVLG
jgi:hypothetical protein